jgi:asparagine synthase (glutamine-hydrolysing)
MCGIVGVISRKGNVERELLIAMRDTMVHRGPDSEGLWLSPDARIGLAHRRLAIVDLSPLGHQPMVDQETGCVLIFNGEIYNYRELRQKLMQNGHTFRGESDTEVLLAAYKQWGVICPNHLDGMFAFAIWDPRQQMLFAARDRAGEKPFYYAVDEAGFRFSSEIKGLLADPSFPRRVDPDALRQLLSLGFVPAPRSIFQGVSKLLPAQAMTYRFALNHVATWVYWRLPSGQSGKVQSGFDDDNAYVARFESVLEDAVRRQMVADVPVGILLSGGIDSSLVTAMAARVSSNKVKTFTMKFPGFGRFDESKHAAQIANHFQTEHYELEAKPASLDLLPRLAEQFDEPMVDSSMIPTFMVSRLIRQHAKVALGGDGGDELFGGYSTYGRLDLLRRLHKLLPFPDQMKQFVIDGARRFYGRNRRGTNYLTALDAINQGRLPSVRSLFQKSELNTIVNRDYLIGLGDWEEHRNGGDSPAESFIYRLCRADFSDYMVEDILTKVDRASMMASLEVRAPWLDHRMIEFAFGFVPDSLKTTLRRRKILPKVLARRLFPVGYDFDRKQGFSLPLSAWFRNGSIKELRDLIQANQLPFIDKAGLNVFFSGDIPSPEKIFGLALLSLWCRHYKVSF